MRSARIFSMATVMALLAAILMTGTVAAASPQVTVVRDTCTLSGGAWNDGFVALRVRATDRGLAGVHVIRFTAQLMHQPRVGGGGWYVHQTQVRAIRVADTAGVQARAWSGVWNFGSDVLQFRHRVEMTVDFMTSGGVVLATRGVFGSSC